jgi:hypothetical protein
MLRGLFLIILGALGASAFVVARKPGARQILERMAPVEAGLGVVGAVMGLLGLLDVLLHLSTRTKNLIPFVLETVGHLSLFGTGFILGFPVIVGYVMRNSPSWVQRAHTLRARLEVKRQTMGLICMVLGVVTILL